MIRLDKYRELWKYIPTPYNVVGVENGQGSIFL